VQLVGVVKDPDPVVYLTGDVTMIGNEGVKTRRPDAFEAKALEVIRGAATTSSPRSGGGTLRAVSGIYAGRQ
jgi:hypothetical protein